MLEADKIIFYLMDVCWVEVNASDVIYSAYFRCFINLFLYPFCMIIERFCWSVLLLMDGSVCSNIPRRNYVQGTSRRLLFACNAYINNQMQKCHKYNIYIITFIVWHVHEAKRWVLNGHFFLIHVANTISITPNLKLVQKSIYYEFVVSITWSI